MRIHAQLIATSAVAFFVAASGCTSRSATFEGYGEDQVWSAMVAAARSPEYDDWKVRDNEVYIDESGRRLEVYAHVWREADRYFAQVRTLLGPAASPPSSTPAPTDAGASVPTPPPLPEEQPADERPAPAGQQPAEPPEQLPER